VITVAKYRSVADADIARVRLEADGIRATIAEENFVTGGYGAMLGLRLQVADADADAARGLLAATDLPALPDDFDPGPPEEEPLPAGGAKANSYLWRVLIFLAASLFVGYVAAHVRGSAASAVRCAARDGRAKIAFDVAALDRDGLRGPADGKRALDYEFCIPDTPRLRAEVQAIDPGVRFMPGSRGRIGCGAGECLCIGSTAGKEFRTVLRRLAALPYVARIEECVYE
jgi:hypothetical protein